MLPTDLADPLISDLRPLQLTDLPRFKQAITEGEQLGWYYFFPFLLFNRLGSQSTRYVWEEAQGSLCLFKHQYGNKNRLDIVFPPFPYQESALRRAVERVNSFNQSHTSWIHFIDEKNMPQVRGLEIFRISKRSPQYLFSPQELIKMAGSRFRNLRRNINTARKQAEINIQPYGPEYAAQCRQLMAKWENKRKNNQRALHYQSRYALNAFHFTPQMEDRDLQGHVYVVNGDVSAFTFGGEIRPGIGCLLLAIADPEITCLSYLVRHHFFANMQKCQTVNDGSDGRESGLREMKQRFRPYGFHTVFTAKQVARLPDRVSSLPDAGQDVSPPSSHESKAHHRQDSPPMAKTANEKSMEASPPSTRRKTFQNEPTPYYPMARYELRPSRMLPDQVGLFALIPFQTEEIVVPYSYFDESRLITWEELESLDATTRDKVAQYCYKDNRGVHAPKDINSIGIFYFINHSCDPNLYCNKKGDFIALRSIQTGEELTADLEKNMKRTYSKFTCSCSSVNCRKIIRI